jgi:hypothetical protein
MLKKIISGGQTGVDQGALAAACKLKIPIGGWAPRGFRCEGGNIPKKYADKMNEAHDLDRRDRTERNVLEGDATIIFCYDLSDSPRTRLTMDLCREHGKPCIDMVTETNMFQDNDDGYEHMAMLLEEFEIIHVVGSRESKFPGIFESSKDRLVEVFRLLQRI